MNKGGIIVNYGRLKGLRVDDYRYPGEESAFRLLEKIPLLDELAGAYLKGIQETVSYPEIQGNCYRVTAKTAPRLHRLYTTALERLDMDQEYPLYVKADFDYNACAYGGNSPLIMLHSSIANWFTDDEILAVLGHELGHIKGKHTIYSCMIQHLRPLIRMIPSLGSALDAGFCLAMLQWYRMHEYSADRAGMIAAGCPDAGISVFSRFLGADAKLPDIHVTREDLLAQAAAFEQENENLVAKTYTGMILLGSSHPWNVLRARELHQWNASGEFDSLIRKYA